MWGNYCGSCSGDYLCVSGKMCTFALKTLAMDTAQNTLNPFVICRAAAGSGKTFTLVKEYLKLAMTVPGIPFDRQNEDFRRALRTRFRGILAITFTNKAAGEMKGRIMDYLEQMARYGADPERSRMGAPLLEALNQQPCYQRHPLDESDLRWMAEMVRSAVLHHFSDLSVCTIDSFMHRIVRTFAHDLNRPVNFEVMIDQEEMVNQAVSQLMSLVGTPGHEELTEVMRAFSESRMEDSKSYRVEGALTSLAGQLFREDTEPFLSALSEMKLSDFVELHKKMTQENRAFEEKVHACGDAVMTLLREAGVDESGCAGGGRGYYGFFRSLSTGEPRPLTATVVKTFEGGKLYSAKCPVQQQAALDGMAGALQRRYEEARELLGVADATPDTEGGALRDYNTRAVLLKNLYSMALLNELAEQLRLYSRENDVVHLSEFNRMINAIVTEQPAPFIYERLGNRYHHFLIDEFQDTSVLQWHNLVPLLENGVSQRMESLVVGDGKQAIYRFRQGDVRQFVALPRVDGMPLHGQTLALPGNYSFDPLDTNYRTASSVVNFNNGFFSWLMEREPFVSNPLAQQIYVGHRDKEGHAELWQQLPAGKVPAVGYVGVSFVDSDDPEAVGECIRQTIVRLVTKQGYRQCDIMVLGRSKRELDYVSTYLQGHPEDLRIEVSSSESFFLVRSHAVMAVVAALRLLADPSDRVAAADLMQRMVNLGLVESLHTEAYGTGGPIDVARILRDEHRGFDFRLDELAALDLYDCCEALIRELHLDGIDTAYLGSLLSRVAAFVQRQHGGVADFLKWFDDNASADAGDARHKQLSAASPEGVDAVRLLTIHKAKGLEAPVVICPFGAPDTHGFSLWVNLDGQLTTVGEGRLPAAFVELSRKSMSRFDSVRDAEKRLSEVDQLNVLYVALTRPKEQLFVVCPTPKKNASGEVNYSALIQQYIDEKHPDMGDAGFCHASRQTDGDAQRNEVSLNRLSFAEWTKKVQVASAAERALSPMQEASVRLGNMAHDLLSKVQHVDDVENAVVKLANEEKLDDEMRTQLGELAREVVRHPDSERFFRPEYEAKTECDLCDAEGVCRPDRVVITPDETWVVDFKTGRDQGEEHDRQVLRYCRAMVEMGYPQVSGWLVYLLPDIRVREVIKC